MVRGQEYDSLLRQLKEYKGTEYFILFQKVLEAKMSDLILNQLDEKDIYEAARLQGAAREIRKLIDEFYPRKMIERADI